MQIVSLTTDFGRRDHYVAELKAAILSGRKDLNILDISHDVDPYDIVQAAFLLQNSLPSFPEGSVHIVAVHLHYRRKSEIVAFEHTGQYFIGPNNGVFSLIFDDLQEEQIYTVPEEGEAARSKTALIAHAASYLAHSLPIEEIGPRVAAFNRKLSIQPVVTSNQIRATVIHIDHYENVIVNLRKEQFEKIRDGRRFSLYYKQNDPITFLSRDYGDVAVGDVLAFFNSAGYLEIAVNTERAASLLNLHKNETIQINFYD
ncbi:MAG: SAM-dependent chlorinase/fluorinase [Saprospiraceae bacterium]|nr:SAM-dependent chlorinase/fluorinase [Saprospiraceae bacterium]